MATNARVAWRMVVILEESHAWTAIVEMAASHIRCRRRAAGKLCKGQRWSFVVLKTGNNSQVCHGRHVVTIGLEAIVVALDWRRRFEISISRPLCACAAVENKASGTDYH